MILPTVFCLVLASSNAVNIRISKNSALGQGFYLPGRNIMDIMDHGANIFENLADDCMVPSPNDLSTKDYTYFSQKKSFYSYVSTQSGLDVGLQGGFTMGITIDVATSSLTSTNLDVKGVVLDHAAITGSKILRHDCVSRAKLNAGLLKGFHNLPIVVTDPPKSSSWFEYEQFLKRYGSHVVTQVAFGSRIQQYTFTKKTDQMNSNQLKIAACLSLGVSGGVVGAKLNICSSYDKKTLESVQNMNYNEKRVVRGGSPATRAKLASQAITADLINKFMDEAIKDPNPVNFKFISIWDLMLRRNDLDVDMKKRLINLKSYYMGYLDFGCTIKGENGFLRKFEQKNSGGRFPTYQCVIPVEGCHDDDSCHIGGSWLSLCHCYGEKCVEHKPVHGIDVKMSKTAEARRKAEGDDKTGINEHCVYRAGPWCACNNPQKDQVEVLWNSDSDSQNIRRFRPRR